LTDKPKIRFILIAINQSTLKKQRYTFIYTFSSNVLLCVKNYWAVCWTFSEKNTAHDKKEALRMKLWIGPCNLGHNSGS